MPTGTNESHPGRTKVDPSQENQWRKLGESDTWLALGTLCRVLVLPLYAQRPFLRCNLDGGIPPESKVVVTIEGNDILIFLHASCEVTREVGNPFFHINGFGVFMSKHGIVNGAFKDIEVLSR